MNRLGIIADVSHASDQTTWDILEASAQPVIASHSNARALKDHPRNLTDEMIRAIAASNGVIGVVAVAGYIADGEVSVSSWADHVDYLAEVAGIDHIAVGCDFYDDIESMGASYDIPAWSTSRGLGPLTVEGMRSWEDLPQLTAELLRRGYDEASIGKIYGGNFARVMSDVCGA
jgi:membrane dipeptidase